MQKNNDFSYCISCQNKKECFENHWCITMDKDGKHCDNYVVNTELTKILNLGEQI